MENILVVLLIIVIVIIIIVWTIKYFRGDHGKKSDNSLIIKLPCKKNFLERHQLSESIDKFHDKRHSSHMGTTHERKHPNMKHSHDTHSFNPYQKGITHERKNYRYSYSPNNVPELFSV